MPIFWSSAVRGLTVSLRSGRVLRHTVEQIGDIVPVVPTLVVPEPQMVDQLVAVFKRFDTAVPEQIIAVPKIPSSSRGHCSNADGGAVGVLVPSFSHWFRWDEAYKTATGSFSHFAGRVRMVQAPCEGSHR